MLKQDYKFIAALTEGLCSQTINDDPTYSFADRSKSHISCFMRIIVIDMFEIVEIAEDYDLEIAFTCTVKSLFLTKSKRAAERSFLVYESLALNRCRKFFQSIYFFGKAHLTGPFQQTENFGQFNSD